VDDPTGLSIFLHSGSNHGTIRPDVGTVDGVCEESQIQRLSSELADVQPVLTHCWEKNNNPRPVAPTPDEYGSVLVRESVAGTAQPGWHVFHTGLSVWPRMDDGAEIWLWTRTARVRL